MRGLPPRVVLREGEARTAQTTLRFTISSPARALVVAEEFGLDAVLGAFLAGMVLRRWAPGDVDALEDKLDVMG